MKIRNATALPRSGVTSPIGILMSLLATASTTISAQEIDAGDDTMVLEEIIVSATRREESLQSVPLSVSVISEEALRWLGSAGFVDYAGIVPGLSFTDLGVVREKQTIRGISTRTFSEVNPATALYLDEVPLTNAGGNVISYNPDPALVDIERVEVLRGPQGTLFGSSAMGGAIRIITHKLDLSRRKGFLNVAISSTKRGGLGYRLAGMLNTPLSGVKAAIRVVGYHHNRDGFIDNFTTGISDANNSEISGGRLAGTILLSDHARLTGRIVHQQRTSDATSLVEPANPARVHSRAEEPNGDEWTNYNFILDAEFGWGTFRFFDLVSRSQHLGRRRYQCFSGYAFRDIESNDYRQQRSHRGVCTGIADTFGWGQPIEVAGRGFYQDQEQRFNQRSRLPVSILRPEVWHRCSACRTIS